MANRQGEGSSGWKNNKRNLVRYQGGWGVLLNWLDKNQLLSWAQQAKAKAYSIRGLREVQESK